MKDMDGTAGLTDNCCVPYLLSAMMQPYDGYDEQRRYCYFVQLVQCINAVNCRNQHNQPPNNHGYNRGYTDMEKLINQVRENASPQTLVCTANQPIIEIKISVLMMNLARTQAADSRYANRHTQIASP